MKNEDAASSLGGKEIQRKDLKKSFKKFRALIKIISMSLFNLLMSNNFLAIFQDSEGKNNIEIEVVVY